MSKLFLKAQFAQANHEIDDIVEQSRRLRATVSARRDVLLSQHVEEDKVFRKRLKQLPGSMKTKRALKTKKAQSGESELADLEREILSGTFTFHKPKVNDPPEVRYSRFQNQIFLTLIRLQALPPAQAHSRWRSRRRLTMTLCRSRRWATPLKVQQWWQHQ